MNGIKCIGFDLKDGSDYEGEFELVSGNRVQKETINSIHISGKMFMCRKR